MLVSSRNQGFGLFLLLVWIFILYIQLSRYRLEPATRPESDERIHLSKEDWIETAITTATDDDFDASAIRAMCDASTWDEETVFTCDGVIGGIGNIRQELLHCIRYAIDAGASLILPEINLRSSDDLSDLKAGTAPLSYLFDQDRFLSRMESACPQMTIFPTVRALERIGPVTKTEKILTQELPHWPLARAYSARDRIRDIRAPAGRISLIPFEHVWQYYPICHDPEEFANTFGKLLPFRSDVHSLAAKILYNLSSPSKYDLPIDPTIETTVPSAKTFIGIHLRTANDILSYWLGYDQQKDYYLSRITSSSLLSSLPLIYIASGNSTSVTSFADEVSSLPGPKTVVTKFDLLSGPDLEALNALTWDQLALVDYLVLARSSYFMGMADSSFAWTITVQRRIFGSEGSCGWRKSFWKGHFLGTALRDEFSDLMGRRAFGWESRMWP